MEIITLSGTLLADSEVCTDKNGNYFCRFKVTCKGTDYSGNTKFTVYRCINYHTGCEQMKKGDQIFVVGALNSSIRVDSNGTPHLNNDVLVQQATRGAIYEKY